MRWFPVSCLLLVLVVGCGGGNTTEVASVGTASAATGASTTLKPKVPAAVRALAGAWRMTVTPLSFNDPVLHEPWRIRASCGAGRCVLRVAEHTERGGVRHLTFRVHGSVYLAKRSPSSPTGECLDGSGHLVASNVYFEHRTYRIRLTNKDAGGRGLRLRGRETYSAEATGAGRAKGCGDTAPSRYRIDGVRSG